MRAVTLTDSGGPSGFESFDGYGGWLVLGLICVGLWGVFRDRGITMDPAPLEPQEPNPKARRKRVPDWHSDPVTKRQVEFLTALGGDATGVTTKGEASELIEGHLERLGWAGLNKPYRKVRDSLHEQDKLTGSPSPREHVRVLRRADILKAQNGWGPSKAVREALLEFEEGDGMERLTGGCLGWAIVILGGLWLVRRLLSE